MINPKVIKVKINCVNPEILTLRIVGLLLRRIGDIDLVYMDLCVVYV